MYCQEDYPHNSGDTPSEYSHSWPQTRPVLGCHTHTTTTDFSEFSRSVVSNSSWPHDCSTPGFFVHHQFLEPTQSHVHWVGDAIQLSHPLSSPSPPAFNLSQSGSFLVSLFFASGGQRIRVPASASILPVNIQDWFPLELAGLVSLQFNRLSCFFQHPSSKASILLCSAFFMVQLSHPYMITGKTIALTRWTFVGKVMSLLSI